MPAPAARAIVRRPARRPFVHRRHSLSLARPDTQIEQLARALADHRPLLAAHGAPRAAVALLVRPQRDGLDLLLIERATREGDPWSGHMAFPGGRSGPEDSDEEATAAREVCEEVGIDVRADGRLLGRLDDVHPRPGAPQIVVSAFVFAVPAGVRVTANQEVEQAVWVPIRELASPLAATEHRHALPGGARLRFPAIGYQGHVIWGITHRILVQFLDFARTRAHPGGSQ